MQDSRQQRTGQTVTVASLCLFLGLVQLAYALLALVLRLFAGTFEVALNLIPAMFAVIPEEPIKIGFPHAFATMIIISGSLLGTLSIVSACRGFYRRQLPKWMALGCLLLAVFLAIIHFGNQLMPVGFVYLAVSGLYLATTILSFRHLVLDAGSANET